MIGDRTYRMIQEYVETAEAPMYLSGFFLSPPRNFHSSEKVTIDVMRDDEDIAIPLPDFATGARHNENNLYTNKGWTPALFKEGGSVNAFKLMKRFAGRDPFEDPQFVADARAEVFETARRLERKIRRSVELMCAQIFKSGAISLVDSAGTEMFSENFSPKASHLITVGAAWAADGTTGDPLLDLENAARQVRRDSKRNPNRLVFGPTAWQRFLANPKVKEQLDKQVKNIARLDPSSRGQGATYYGDFWVGAYRFECWLYEADYRHPQTGNLTPYVEADHVLMLSDGARLDLTYGAIPRLRPPDSAAASFLPGRISAPDAGLDIIMNAWFTPDGESLLYSLGSRPLPIPTAIDSFARLDVVP